MRPTTLMLTTLIAGTVAAVAPQIATPLKTAFAPGATASGGNTGPAAVQIGWPGSTRPVVLRRVGQSYSGFLPLRNTSAQAVCVAIEAHVQAADGAGVPVELTPPESFLVDKFAATIQLIQLALKPVRPPALPATGFLHVTSGQASGRPAVGPCTVVAGTDKSVDQEIRIPERSFMGEIFGIPLIVVGLIVLITGINLHRRGVGLFFLMGQANWAFEKSWGANVTLGAALLMTLIGLTAFPDRPQLMSKLSYSMLQMLFAALVAMAPLVYNLIRREVVVSNGSIDTRGYVVAFLFAGGFVLWAALGQITTLGVLVEEFVRGGGLDATTGIILQVLCSLLGALLIVYGFRSLYRTAKGVSAPVAVVGGLRPGPQPPAASVLGGLPDRMTEWSIL